MSTSRSSRVRRRWTSRSGGRESSRSSDVTVGEGVTEQEQDRLALAIATALDRG